MIITSLLGRIVKHNYSSPCPPEHDHEFRIVALFLRPHKDSQELYASLERVGKSLEPIQEAPVKYLRII